MPLNDLSLSRLSHAQWACKGVLAVAFIGYTLGVIALTISARMVGERCWLLSFLIFLPPTVWLLPVLILAPVAALVSRPMLAIIAFGIGVVVFGFAQFRFGFGARSAAAGEKTLTLMTNNIGQSNHQSMAPFVRQQNPDFLLIQEAVGHSPYYKRAYPDRFVAAVGEFVLVSRFPIASATLVPEGLWAKRTPAAALFRVQWPVHPLSIYAVHIPTPRPDFALFRGHGFLVELVRNRGPAWNQYGAYGEAMHQRVEVAKRLAEAIAKDPNPVLVGGDFNMPSWGYVHSIFSSRLSDAFEVSGYGFGFSFPGTTHNPLSLFGPWLRLDYVFCNRWWTPIGCWTEPRRASQHRAVAATFSFASQ